MQWRGSASVDPRFSAAMLPWSIADIYSRDQFLNVSTYPSTYLYYSEFESTEKKGILKMRKRRDYGSVQYSSYCTKWIVCVFEYEDM